jgi:phosphatidylserine synthase|tara:strand:+ start:773 stop:1048 length:276 start_codon:yes stop_codon:yes gene_type:complete
MKNNLANNVSFKLNTLPAEMDVLAVVFVLFLVVLLCNRIPLPEYTQLAFLLALIVLISCYNIEISIVVVVVAIIYVLLQNNMNNRNEERNN